MKTYRITKYNPKFRNELGHYLRNDWTDYSDIGKGKFLDEGLVDGKLTYEEYSQKEISYINVIMFFLNKNKRKYIRIKNIEIYSKKIDKNTSFSMIHILENVKNGMFVEITDVPDLCRLILRGYLWAKLYSIDMLIYFGYEYYMYMAFPGKCSGLTKKVQECGLFIEEIIFRKFKENPANTASD